MTPKIRSAHILGYLDLRFGGPPRAGKQLARALEWFDVHVSLWGTYEGKDALESNGIEMHGFAPQFPKAWFYQPELRRALEVAAQTVDVFHLHEVWSYPQYAAANMALAACKPFVVSPHGVFNQRWRYLTLKKRAYLATLGRQIVNDAACFVALNKEEETALREIGVRQPIAIVPNGVDPDEFSRLPPPSEAEEIWPELRGRRVLLFLSRISRTKGLEHLIQALSEVVDDPTFRDLILVIAGPDDRGFQAEIAKTATRLNLERFVRFFGLVDGLRKFQLISRADVFVLPSMSEGQSLSLLENLAAGNPVLITPGCNFNEAIHAGAGVLTDLSVSALRNNIRQIMMNSPAELREMGRRGQELVVNQFTWKRSAELLAAVYDEVRGRV